MPYLSTFVCHAARGKRQRYPDSAGTPGAQGREDHHDLHPFPQPSGKGVMSPWTICRGETEVSYTETIYSPIFIAEYGFIF